MYDVLLIAELTCSRYVAVRSRISRGHHVFTRIRKLSGLASLARYSVFKDLATFRSASINMDRRGILGCGLSGGFPIMGKLSRGTLSEAFDDYVSAVEM